MKIYVPHPYRPEEAVYSSSSGKMIGEFNLLQALATQCEIFMPAQEPLQYQDNIHGIPMIFESIEKTVAWYEQQAFDAVLMLEPNVDDLVFLRHVCPSPIVVHVPGGIGKTQDNLNKALNCYSLLRPYDALVPRSCWVSKKLKKMVLDPSYIHPIVGGVNPDIFKYGNKQNAKQELAEVSNDQRLASMPLVGFCNRFEPAKGAYSIIRAADLNPDILFVIVGKQFVPVLHPPNVIFLGAQLYNTMPLYYNALDILCSLSIDSDESIPLGVFEGMACGLPIIATNHAGICELPSGSVKKLKINSFETEALNLAGYIDPELLSLQIQELMNNEEQRQELSKRAMECIPKFFWVNVAHQYIELFGHLIWRQSQRRCPVPLSIQFTQQYTQDGCVHSMPKAYNFMGNQPGPLFQMPFGHLDISFIEGLGLYLAQVLHPNEVETVMMGVIGDRKQCRSILHKIRAIGDMLAAP